MWKTTFFAELLAGNPQLHFVHFHNCAHGGTRDKRTCFLTNVEWFDSLQIFCNKHAPWTPTVINGKVTFPTHSEAAYPELLCQRMSSLVKDQMLKRVVVDVDNLPQQTASSGKSLNRVVLGALPRGKHVKPLVSENGLYLNVIADVQQSETQLQQFLTQLPKGAAIQSRRILTWGEVRDAMAKNIKKRELSNKLNQLKASQGIDPCADEVVVDLDEKFGCQPGSFTNFLRMWKTMTMQHARKWSLRCPESL